MNKLKYRYLVRLGMLLLLFTLIFAAGGTAFAGTTVVKVVPGQVSEDCQTVTADVTIENFPQGLALDGVNIALKYDSNILKYKSVQNGSFFPANPAPGFVWMTPDSSVAGTVVFSAGNFGGAIPTATSGTVLTVTFDVLANGVSNVIPDSANVHLTQTIDSKDLPATVQGANINITCKPVPVIPAIKVIPGQISEDCKTVTADVTIEGFPKGKLLDGVNIALKYNSTILNYKNVQSGSFFPAEPAPGFVWMTPDSSVAGTVVFSAGNFGGAIPAATSGTVLTVTFDVLANGTANVVPDLDNVNLTPPQGDDLTVTVQGADITITCVLAPPVAPSVQTGVAGKTTTTAVLNGSIVTNGGAAITDYGFYWGTKESNLTKQAVGDSDFGGAFTLNLSNLEPETTYYYRAYATNAVDTSYGELKNFTTDKVPAPIAPTVQTGDAGKDTTTAVLNGTIVSNNGSAITDYGFNWGTDQANLVKKVVGNSDFSGAFTLNLSNLTQNTTYYYQAYATNAGGTTLGDIKEFTTDKAPLGITVTLDKTQGVNSERPLAISGATSPATTVSWQVVVKDNNGIPVLTSTPPAGSAFSGVVYQPGDFGGLPFTAEYTVNVTATPAEGDPVVLPPQTFGVSNFNYFINDITFSGSGSTRTVTVDVSKSGALDARVQGICQVTSATGKVVCLKIGEPVAFGADSENHMEFQLEPLEAGTYSVQFFLWIQDGDNWRILSEPQTVSLVIGEAM